MGYSINSILKIKQVNIPIINLKLIKKLLIINREKFKQNFNKIKQAFNI